MCLDVTGAPLKRVWCLYECDNTITVHGPDRLILLTPNFSVKVWSRSGQAAAERPAGRSTCALSSTASVRPPAAALRAARGSAWRSQQAEAAYSAWYSASPRCPVTGSPCFLRSLRRRSSPAAASQDMASIFKQINVLDAGAYKQADKDKILEDIVRHHGSTTAFDNKLKLLFLLEPLDTQAELEVRDMPRAAHGAALDTD
jgi:hypothetical protein